MANKDTASVHQITDRITRRTFLATTGSGTVTVLAGCSDDSNSGSNSDDESESDNSNTTDDSSDDGNSDSNGDDESGSDDSNTTDDSSDDGQSSDGNGVLSPKTHDEFGEDPEEEPLFYANPNVTGPGDNAEYVMALEVSPRGEAEDYERFIVTIDSGTLHRNSGDDVTVPIDVTVDLLESAEEEERFILASGLGIPTGDYTGLTYEVTPVDISHIDGGDVTDEFEQPPTAEHPEAAEVGVDNEYWTLGSVTLTNEFSPTFEESLTLGSFII